MVTIRKRPAKKGGFYYEIEDYQDYVKSLDDKGIGSPQARYRIYVSAETERFAAQDHADWESAIARFFKLGSASGITYQIVGA